jgi:hypothetical protein
MIPMLWQRSNGLGATVQQCHSFHPLHTRRERKNLLEGFEDSCGQVGTSWGLALIIGPALGGYLSQVPDPGMAAAASSPSPLFPVGCKTLDSTEILFSWMLFCSLHSNTQVYSVRDLSLHGKGFRGVHEFAFF